MSTMRAMAITEYGGSEKIAEIQVPRPTLEKPTDVIVRVEAVAMNPVDYKKRNGFGNADAPVALGFGGAAVPHVIMGYDGAGVVEEAGEESRFPVGTEVYFAGDIFRQGCNAEFIAIDSRICGRKPTNLSMAQAAAVPLTALTAWEPLVEKCNMREGQSVLVLPGAGGVGSIAIQIAKHRGCRVAATASRPESEQWCRDMGADVVVSHYGDMGAALTEAGLDSFDHILCLQDLTAEFARLHPMLAPHGKIVIVNPPSEPLSLGPIFAKSGTIVQELMFTRPAMGPDPEGQGAILDEVATLIEAGTLRTTMNGEPRSMWTDLGAVQDEQAGGRVSGKLCLTTN